MNNDPNLSPIQRPMLSNCTENSIPRKRDLRISYVLKEDSCGPNEENDMVLSSTKHCFGVNALAVGSNPRDETEVHLFSGGRDSTIREWKILKNNNNEKISTEGDGSNNGVNDFVCNSPAWSVRHVYCYSDHVHWINDLVLIGNNQEKLVSCSSDTTVRLWDVFGAQPEHSSKTLENPHCEGRLLNTLDGVHSDYVVSLAYCASRSLLSSCALDGRLVLWDTVSDLHPISIINIAASHSSAKKTKTSSYCHAASDAGGLLITGSSDHILRAWDVRTGQKTFKLRGHTDNIRCCVLSADGSKCLSAGSDHTIRLWDLGQQKCIQIFRIHQDSVWSLAVNQDFSSVFSSGKDRNIMLTNLSTFRSQVLFTEEHSVLKLCYKENTGSLWVSTVSPVIKQYSVSLKNTSNAEILRDLVIEGRGGIVKHCILQDRVHVITKDEEDNVDLWNVLNGRKVSSFGRVSFEEICQQRQQQQLTDMISTPSWFSIDTTTGSLMVQLESPQCFSARVYPVDIGIFEEDEDKKDSLVNLGENVLRCLFSRWLNEREKSKILLDSVSSSTSSLSTSTKSSSETSSTTTEGRSIESGTAKNDETDKSNYDSKQTTRELNNNPNDVGEKKVHRNSTEFKGIHEMDLLPPDTPVIVSDLETGATVHHCLAKNFTGEEPVGTLIPIWVAECLLLNKIPPSKLPNISFILISANERQLPQLKNPRLNGPRWVKLKKLSEHIVTKLMLRFSTTTEPEIKVQNCIEILVNNKVLSPDITLGTVKAFLWKNGDEIKCIYRLRSKYLGQICAGNNVYTTA